jgi:hypothetical protein
MFNGVSPLTAGFAALNFALLALAATALAVEPNNWFDAEINHEPLFESRAVASLN